MKPVIHWFRQDLRLHDNPSLHALSQTGAPVLPIYIFDEPPTKAWAMGSAQKWWLYHSLHALNASLQGHLIIGYGPVKSVLTKLIDETQASEISWNRCYEPYRINQDTDLKAYFKNKGLKVNSYNSHLLFEPWTLLTLQNKPYKVFTPYWKACLKQPSPAAPLSVPIDTKWYKGCHSVSIDDLKLLPTHPNWAKGFEEWKPGEHNAYTQAGLFIKKSLHHYKKGRDFPSTPLTSRLSPYLHFGELSPRWLWQQIHTQNASTDAQHFLSELGWREFSYHLLYHFPHLPHASFRPEFEKFSWKNHPNHLNDWQKGLTGYPIVDAGMRQLWQTGWMHNRVRMIVASFLIKDLQIDWRKGEEWFWDTLLDADLASNAASWQWVAGSGADAAPYFRIFNPIRQGETFDPDGEYVRTWVPELKDLPNKWIHQPFNAPTTLLAQASITLGSTYPHPLVDHSTARKQALLAYSMMNHEDF